MLTNDGDMAAALTHPAGETEKVYRVKVWSGAAKPATPTDGRGFGDGFAQATNVREVRGRGPASGIELVDC